MPFSDSSMLSPIMAYVESLQPSSVLDVGVGFAQYGVLLRNNLEKFDLFEWDDTGYARKRDKEEWQVRIDGIEGFEPYITPVHRYVYTSLFIGDALEVLPAIKRHYELVLATEILEHFDKEDGYHFIEMLKSRCAGSIIISTPKEFVPSEYPANPYENHRSFWSQEELIALGFDRILPDEGSVICCYEAGAQ